MFKIFNVFAMGLFFSFSVFSQQNSWVGKYEYSYSANSNNGFFAWDYVLTVNQKGNELVGIFVGQGTQLDDNFEVKIVPQNSAIKVLFQRDLTGNVKDWANPLKRGQLLFSLTKVKIKGKERYLLGKNVLLLEGAKKMYFIRK